MKVPATAAVVGLGMWVGQTAVVQAADVLRGTVERRVLAARTPATLPMRVLAPSREWSTQVTASAAAVAAPSKKTKIASHTSLSDASWAKLYTTSCGPAPRRCLPSTNGYENDFLWDRRLPGLLRASFPQRQWFWLDRGGFTSLPHLVLGYLSVPGSASLDDGRYFTANGCVPHVCEDRGMLWIDTATHPVQLIFVATDDVGGGSNGPDNMLWIFSSSKLNWTQLPHPFLTSYLRWQSELIRQDPFTFSSGFLVANLVQPDGEIVALSPSVLTAPTTASGRE